MLRIGIIGLGNIGKVHAKNIQDGLVHNATLTAVARTAPAAMEEFRKTGVNCFTNPDELIKSGKIDAVVVALPTFLHANVGCSVLNAGLHLMMEKPLALHKAEAEKILAARKSEKQVFALMMNQRTNPCYTKLREWIPSGAIGRLQRMSWINTDWFRPEIYYQSSSWRATWKGEGGGVLMNQCPHNLDIMQWLIGMPSTIRANCSFGKYHNIEVEDEVTAYMEFAGGATGTFITSTGESPGVNRLEITGDLATIRTDGTEASITRNSEPASIFSQSTSEMFGSPKTTVESFKTATSVNQHAIILDNFVESITSGKPLIAPATEGLKSLELAGAMLLSTWTNSTIRLPLDSAFFENHINKAVARSKLRSVVHTNAQVDMSKSYR